MMSKKMFLRLTLVEIVFFGLKKKMPRFLSVQQRRALGEDDGWVCDSCGDTWEECLVTWATGRCTRSDPNGDKVVILCDLCAEKVPHGQFVDQ